MKDFTSFLTNPLYIAGVSGNNPSVGANLAAAALEQRNQQSQQMQQQELQVKQQEALRQQQIQEMLPQLLSELDPNDLQGSFQKLASQIGPENAIPIINQLSQLQTGEANIQNQQANQEINREELGLKRQEFGLKTQEHALKVQELQQKLSGDLSPEDRAKATTDLRKELNALGQTKDFEQVKTAYEKIKSAAKNPSAANDLAVIFSYMKLLDPASVVREGEQASAQNATGVPDRIKNIYNKALTGERLAPEQRKDFIKSAKDIYKSQAKIYKNTTSKYETLAKKQNLSPEEIILNNPGEEIEEEIAPIIEPVQNKRNLSESSIERLRAIAARGFK